MGASSSSSDAQEWFPSCSREIDPTCNICAPTPDCSPQRGVGSATATPLETRLPGGYPLGRGGREGMFRPANRPFTPRKLPAGSFSQVPAAAVPSQTTNVHIGSSRRLTSDRVDDSVLHSFTDQVAAAPRTPRTRAADKDIRGDSWTILALPCSNGKQSDPDFCLHLAVDGLTESYAYINVTPRSPRLFGSAGALESQTRSLSKCYP